MARIIDGDVSTFNALAYGEKHLGTQQFLYSHMENMSHVLTDAGRRFFDASREVFQQMEKTRTGRLIKAAQRAVGSIWQSDEIRYLCTVGEFQWAPEKMRRYIMAQPEVRQMYHEQRLEGYEGWYKDAYPTDIGETHWDYRRVMNGVVVEGEGELDWTASTYYEDGDYTLEPDMDFLDQVDVLDSWNTVVHLIRQGGDDPTSHWNSSL